MPCCLRHTSLFTRCGTTACVPFLSVSVIWDLLSKNTIPVLLFCISLSCSQINHFRAYPRFVLLKRLLLCASPSTCPAKDTGKNIRAGQFQDMLGIEEGIKRIKEREEAIHPPDQKMLGWRENCRKKGHYFFQNRKLPLT